MTQAAPPEPSAWKRGVLVLPILQLVAILAAGYVLLTELSRLDGASCVGIDAETPGWRFVAVALAGLLVGRYSGAWRFFTWHASDPADPSDRDPASVFAGRLALAVVLAALVPIFIYEAIGVYQPVNGYEPITYYVRCSIRFDNDLAGGLRTMAILFVIGFLFGQWLWSWHPGADVRSGSSRRHRGSATGVEHNPVAAGPGAQVAHDAD
jgi:hypothetical protein